MELNPISANIESIKREDQGKTVKLRYLVSPSKIFTITIRGSHLQSLVDEQIKIIYQPQIQKLIDTFQLGEKTLSIKVTPHEIKRTYKDGSVKKILRSEGGIDSKSQLAKRLEEKKAALLNLIKEDKKKLGELLDSYILQYSKTRTYEKGMDQQKTYLLALLKLNPETKISYPSKEGNKTRTLRVQDLVTSFIRDCQKNTIFDIFDHIFPPQKATVSASLHPQTPMLLIKKKEKSEKRKVQFNENAEVTHFTQTSPAKTKESVKFYEPLTTNTKEEPQRNLFIDKASEQEKEVLWKNILKQWKDEGTFKELTSLLKSKKDEDAKKILKALNTGPQAMAKIPNIGKTIRDYTNELETIEYTKSEKKNKIQPSEEVSEEELQIQKLKLNFELIDQDTIQDLKTYLKEKKEDGLVELFKEQNGVTVIDYKKTDHLSDLNYYLRSMKKEKPLRDQFHQISKTWEADGSLTKFKEYLKNSSDRSAAGILMILEGDFSKLPIKHLALLMKLYSKMKINESLSP